MKSYKFSSYKFLIVDDHNFSRVSVLRLLKNMGDPESASAEHGLAALDILSERPNAFHCVIADFNMPTMHGLQLLKRIRIGEKNIPRNIPVIMLTGHGETCLVKLAIELDVNSFLLKPVTKDALGQRLNNILLEEPEKYNNESWLKPAQDYEAIDVDTPILEILNENAAKQLKEEIKVEILPPAETDMMCDIADLKEWMVLAKDLVSTDGSKILTSGSQLNAQRISSLRDLAEMKLISQQIVIRK